jgi:hypothetical protein
VLKSFTAIRQLANSGASVWWFEWEKLVTPHANHTPVCPLKKLTNNSAVCASWYGYSWVNMNIRIVKVKQSSCEDDVLMLCKSHKHHITSIHTSHKSHTHTTQITSHKSHITQITHHTNHTTHTTQITLTHITRISLYFCTPVSSIPKQLSCSPHTSVTRLTFESCNALGFIFHSLSTVCYALDLIDVTRCNKRRWGLIALKPSSGSV